MNRRNFLRSIRGGLTALALSTGLAKASLAVAGERYGRSPALIGMDLAKPGSDVSAIVQILCETNELLEDMVWVESAMTVNRTTIRTGLPHATWRKLEKEPPPVALHVNGKLVDWYGS